MSILLTLLPVALVLGQHLLSPPREQDNDRWDI